MNEPFQKSLAVWCKSCVAVFLMVFGLIFALRFEMFGFTKGFDLLIHESGHLFFSFFGEFGQFLGGTLMQLLVPIGVTIYFFMTGRLFSSAVTVYWIGQNFIDIAIYIKDARAQVLPLVGGGIHDWHYMLGRLNLLEYDQTIANVVLLGAIILIVASGMLGIYFAWNTPFQQVRDFQNKFEE